MNMPDFAWWQYGLAGIGLYLVIGLGVATFIWWKVCRGQGEPWWLFFLFVLVWPIYYAALIIDSADPARRKANKQQKQQQQQERQQERQL